MEVEELVEEIVTETVEKKADDAVADAVEIAETIVETAKDLSHRDDSHISDLVNARFDGVERSLAMLDEKINGVFDSLAILDALISEIRDMERREENREEARAVEPATEIEVSGDAETVVIAPETPKVETEINEPQKRSEKRTRKWL